LNTAKRKKSNEPNCGGDTLPVEPILIETTTLNMQQHIIKRSYQIDSTKNAITFRNLLSIENINNAELEKYQGVSANFSCIPS
jgi:hypothetical protein